MKEEITKIEKAIEEVNELIDFYEILNFKDWQLNKLKRIKKLLEDER